MLLRPRALVAGELSRQITGSRSDESPRRGRGGPWVEVGADVGDDRWGPVVKLKNEAYLLSSVGVEAHVWVRKI